MIREIELGENWLQEVLEAAVAETNEWSDDLKQMLVDCAEAT